MKQFFLLLLVAVAAAALSEEVEEGESAVKKRLKDRSALGSFIKVHYPFLFTSTPCDKTCPKPGCKTINDERRCVYASRGDACSRNGHCCSLNCNGGTCGCSPNGLPCQLGSTTDCCKGTCKPILDEMTKINYGICK